MAKENRPLQAGGTNETGNDSIPINFTTDGEGLEHGDGVHADDCHCQPCADYYSQRGWPRSWEPLRVPDCEGADCEGCINCPETPARDMFGPGSFLRVATLADLRNMTAESEAMYAEQKIAADADYLRNQFEGEELEPVEPEPKPVYYRQFDLSEWLNRATEKTVWHLPILAPAGLLTLLSAGPKAGKTQLYWGLLKEAHELGTVLGETIVPGLRVVFWTEEGPQSLNEKANVVHLADIPPWHIVGIGDLENRDWDKMVDAAINQWTEGQESPDILFVDTIGDWALNDDWNDYAKVIAVIAPLQRLKMAFPHMAIVAVHHNRKAAGNAVDAASGSNALTGKVDNIISLDKPDSCDDYTRRLRFMGRVKPVDREGRDLMDGVDLYVRFDPTTGTYAKTQGGKRFEDMIMDVLPDGQPGMTNKEILEAIGADDDGVTPSARTIASILTRLHNAGDIDRVGSGKRGDAYRYAAR